MIPLSTEDEALFEDLLQRARAGEHAAMDALFRRSWRALERHAAKSPALGLQGATRPSDIFQQSALRAFEKLSSFRGQTEGEWFAWLKKVVFTQSQDVLRAEARDAQHVPGGRAPDGEEVEAIPSEERTPSQFTARREEWRRLLSMFRHLPAEQGEAFVLCWLHELTVEEASRRMKKSHAAVSSLLQRGMATLRRQMREDAGPLQDESEVSAALEAYFRRRDAGAPLDLEAFIAEHPSCAGQLREVLDFVTRLRPYTPAISP
ncbi:RNA polymerase sigma factor [Corallococcus macrosporus]|uniref:ECF family RNA polymerase sigma factor n=1 Tax=Myxococcus fulvus (strain ATCC BAA-855 / HW-1) TaxID=483219 RepID=F8CKZ3_MYXFH|nr:sigma-70 family RNA polymerase sigma factor [Corallococcus macrosporus]AEI63906.1 ECF family RNA polymerase sigma factor [Corallococcus macrosporus]